MLTEIDSIAYVHNSLIITHNNDQIREISDKDVSIVINTELETNAVLFHGNEIWGTSWIHIKKFLDKYNVQLPENKLPCTNCSGSKCSLLCLQDTSLAA